MKIKPYHPVDTQMSKLGNHLWSVARLIELARDLPVMEIPLDHLNVSKVYAHVPMRDMVMHMNAVNECSLDHPIILDEEGEVMDGRHRIMKAMLTGAKSIKAVRFDENPSPCKVEDE